ncbi:unnamed protein product [Hydatigera taeniaeformis]|uniref:DUF5731 domain-containing protein n=1 Tax=Hydatigena taeniaeformis TaxID=6205 RepID=A0A0R3WJM7_HYDTA|nr:unnamed protein product [Hydatigera taeniaeformis]
MNTTCTRITLPASIFSPRLITPYPRSTTTKAAVTSRSRPLMDGFTRRLRTHRTRVCAWLERGGIFDSALMPQSRPRALLQDRLHCATPDDTSGGGDNASRWGPAPHACSPFWADYDDPRSVTFKWIGTDGKSIRFLSIHSCHLDTYMPLYEFQLHTCGNLFSPLTRSCCQGDQIAFELQQRGTWLYLNEFRCRCRAPAQIREITYARPLPPSSRSIEPRFISMTCQEPVSSRISFT